MDVKSSVQAELDQLPEQLRDGPLAASALVLAELMAEASPRDAATLSRELRLTLTELHAAARAAAPSEVDPVDELASRRAARITSPAPDRPATAGRSRPRRDRPGGQRRPGAG